MSPPIAVPRPIKNGPPPSRTIFNEMKFQAALNPTHTSNAAARNPQNRGAALNTAPTVPRRPCASTSLGLSRTIVVLHARTTRLATA